MVGRIPRVNGNSHEPAPAVSATPLQVLPDVLFPVFARCAPGKNPGNFEEPGIRSVVAHRQRQRRLFWRCSAIVARPQRHCQSDRGEEAGMQI